MALFVLLRLDASQGSQHFFTDQVILGTVLGAVLGRRCPLIIWIHLSDYVASVI
jgi:hypothetical protein